MGKLKNLGLELNQIYNECCLEGMNRIPDKSVDMILCDLPYAMTGLKWDVIIPFDDLWQQYDRIIKDCGVIVLTGSQPFTTLLGASNLKKLKYGLIWEKNNGTNFLQVKKMPFKTHEDILIFYDTKSVVAKKSNLTEEEIAKLGVTYNPQMVDGKPVIRKKGVTHDSQMSLGFDFKILKNSKSENEGKHYPTSVIKIGREVGLHPTQKPVELFEWLIKTYSNEGELIMDNCMGSGTTAIAALNTNRNFIGFEKDEKYFKVAIKRIKQHRLKGVILPE